MSTTPDRAQTQTSPKPDSLRSTRAGEITASPARGQPLMLLLLCRAASLSADPAVLADGQLRIAPRRLERLQGAVKPPGASSPAAN